MPPKRRYWAEPVEDAQAYFLEIVEPALADYEKCPHLKHRAFLACAALLHTADYLVAKGGGASQRAARGKRDEYSEKSSAFEIVDLVGHAFKHVESNGQFSVREGGVRTSHKDIVRRDIGAFNTAAFNEGPTFGTGRRVLMVRTKDGIKDLLPIVRQAAAFLRAELELPPKRSAQNNTSTPGA